MIEGLKKRDDFWRNQQEEESSKQRIQNRRKEDDQFDDHRGVGLEKLFMKISKMNEGERSELEELIDKIDSGELSVQALKSLLFLQKSNHS